MNKKTILVVVAVLLVGGAAFYGGMIYDKNKSGPAAGGPSGFQNLSAEQRQQLMQNGGLGGRGGMGGGPGGQNGGFVAGEVLSKDDKSLTVKLPDGGSKIIFYSGTTAVSKMTAGSMGDVSVGSSVTVIGSNNSDGSVTATSIQIRPDINPAQTFPAN